MIQSYLFDFQTVPTFFDNWNVNFKLMEMNTSNKFQFVFCDYAPDNIEQCLNGTVLNTSTVTIAKNYLNQDAVVDCSLAWDSASRTISLRDDVEWNVGDGNAYLKAVFLRNKDTGYVMGYCIHMNSFDVTNKVTFDEGTVLWSISDGQ